MNALLQDAVHSHMSMVTVRASALPDFFDCPARAEARHLLGKRTPMGAAALLGRAIHASTAVFDQSSITGQGITITEAAGAAVDMIRKPDEEVALDEDDSLAQTESIAIAMHTRYCKEIAPTQDYAAVEVKCERLEITDLGLALTGTTDRVRRVDDGHGIADLKSGKTAVKADGHVETKGARYQIGVYELLAERGSGLAITAPGQVVGLQTGKTERGQRVGVSGPILGAREVLIGEPDSPGVLEMLARMIHTGSFPGNPRSMMCGEKYCPIFNSCKYRK